MTRTALIATSVLFIIVGIATGWFVFDNERGHSGSLDARSKPQERAVGVTGTVWVANEGSNTLSGVDAATGRIVATVKNIPSPHNVQATGPRSVLAVSSDSLVRAIDTDTMTTTAIARTGAHPAHVIASPDGTRVYVSNSGDDTVSVFDDHLRRLKTVAVGEFPHGLRSSPDGSLLLVANMRATTVSVIDARSYKAVATIDVGAGPVQTAFHPNSEWAYTTLNTDDEIVRIDLASRKVVARQKVDAGPLQSFVTPDGSRIVVASQGTEERPSRTVAVLDAHTLRALGTVETGEGAHGVVIEPSSRYAYVTNIYSGTISIVDIDELRVIRTIRTGKEPNGVTFSSHVHTGSMPARLLIDTASGARHGHED